MARRDLGLIDDGHVQIEQFGGLTGSPALPVINGVIDPDLGLTTKRAVIVHIKIRTGLPGVHPIGTAKASSPRPSVPAVHRSDRTTPNTPMSPNCPVITTIAHADSISAFAKVHGQLNVITILQIQIGQRRAVHHHPRRRRWYRDC